MEMEMEKEKQIIEERWRRRNKVEK